MFRILQKLCQYWLVVDYLLHRLYSHAIESVKIYWHSNQENDNKYQNSDKIQYIDCAGY
jgi:hypothetical protein